MGTKSVPIKKCICSTALRAHVMVPGVKQMQGSFITLSYGCMQRLKETVQHYGKCNLSLTRETTHFVASFLFSIIGWFLATSTCRVFCPAIDRWRSNWWSFLCRFTSYLAAFLYSRTVPKYCWSFWVPNTLQCQTEMVKATPDLFICCRV